jgi:hypothetical protein
MRIDSRTAERVQQWDSSDPHAAAVASSLDSIVLGATAR